MVMKILRKEGECFQESIRKLRYEIETVKKKIFFYQQKKIRAKQRYTGTGV